MNFSSCQICKSDNTIIIQRTIQLPKKTGILHSIEFLFVLLMFLALFAAVATASIDLDDFQILGSITMSIFFLILAGNMFGVIIFAQLYHNLRPFRTETHYYILCKECGNVREINILPAEDD